MHTNAIDSAIFNSRFTDTCGHCHCLHAPWALYCLILGLYCLILGGGWVHGLNWCQMAAWFKSPFRAMAEDVGLINSQCRDV